MKKNTMLVVIAILIGLALSVTQVFAAAPDGLAAKKTPPPANPGTTVDEQPGNKPAVPPGQLKKEDKQKPEKDNPGLGPKEKHANKPEGKPGKPYNFRGEITAVTTANGTTSLAIALKKGGEAVVVLDETTAIHVPNHSWNGTPDYLGEGVEVTVKAYLVQGAEGMEDYFLASTIHVIPVTPLHLYYTGLVTVVPVDWTAEKITLTVGDKVFDITGATIMPLEEGETLQVGDLVTVVYKVNEDGTLLALSVVVREKAVTE